MGAQDPRGWAGWAGQGVGQGGPPGAPQPLWPRKVGFREDRREACRCCPDLGPPPTVGGGLGSSREEQGQLPVTRAAGTRVTQQHWWFKIRPSATLRGSHTGRSEATQDPCPECPTPSTGTRWGPAPCPSARVGPRSCPRPPTSTQTANCSPSCEASGEGKTLPDPTTTFPGPWQQPPCTRGFWKGHPGTPDRGRRSQVPSPGSIACGGLTSKPPMTSRAWMLYVRMFSTIFSM